jgi:hypothetical protein
MRKPRMELMKESVGKIGCFSGGSLGLRIFLAVRGEISR